MEDQRGSFAGSSPKVVLLDLSETSWPVYQGYFMEDDAIKPKGTYHVYFPAQQSSLPMEFGKVIPGSPETAVAFVRHWGNLEYTTEEFCRFSHRQATVYFQEDPGGDRLEDLYQQAYKVRVVLRTFKAMQDKNLPLLESICNSWWESINEASRDPVRERMELLGLSDPSPMTRAGFIISSMVSSGVFGARQATIFQPPAGFRNTLICSDLMQVVWWHLANIVTSSRPVARCEACGGFFMKTDSRQRFCPPDFPPTKSRKGVTIRQQSRCGLISRARRHQEKMKLGHEGSGGTECEVT